MVLSWKNNFQFIASAAVNTTKDHKYKFWYCNLSDTGNLQILLTLVWGALLHCSSGIVMNKTSETEKETWMYTLFRYSTQFPITVYRICSLQRFPFMFIFKRICPQPVIEQFLSFRSHFVTSLKPFYFSGWANLSPLFPVFLLRYFTLSVIRPILLYPLFVSVLRSFQIFLLDLSHSLIRSPFHFPRFLNSLLSVLMRIFNCFAYHPVGFISVAVCWVPILVTAW